MNMQVNPEEHWNFTGFEYLMMDIAAAYGLDKLTFPERLEWAIDHIDCLEQLAADKGHWKELPLYMKGVFALRKAQVGEPIGHVVALDAVCSGMQILSAISGCIKGAKATGMIDPDRRADAYTDCMKVMQEHIAHLA